MDYVGGGLAGTGVPVCTGSFAAVVIGASFGGPKAIESILSALPSDLPVPIAISQHITEGMTGPWAELLSARTGLDVREGANRMPMVKGSAYIAPAGSHMRFERDATGFRLRVDADFADSLYVPSIDIMFSSASQTFASRTLAVVLTGLGSDGASGMLKIRTAGGYTIGESEATALSYSMPGAAAAAGALVEQLPLERIAARIVALLTGS